MGQPTGFHDGYCSRFNCQQDSDCAGENAYCAFNGQNNFCLASCETSDDCRALYRCIPLDGESACVPGDCESEDDCGEGQICDNGLCGTADANIGDPCQSDGDCQAGDFCITEDGENNEGYYDGYCSRFGCSPNTSGECGEDGICIPIDMRGNGLCLLACEEDEECRDGGLYECRLLYSQLPESSTSCLPVECFDDTDCPDDSTCDLLTSVCSR
jgi:hypothetical protein